MDKIVAADASPDEVIVLSDESSRWGSNVFIAVSKDVPDAKMTRISGTFLAKVFEGHYREMGTWVRDMKTWVSDQGKTLQKLYFYYTTCPKCAKQTGKNYVVLLGQV
jgi:hypothetical protein